MFKKLGFTMIELLIVIAVLGILAVAVLAAINPIEQINRGKDTGSRSDAEQLLSAIERFYAIQGFYPWMTGVTESTTNTPVRDTLTLVTAVADVAGSPDTGTSILEKLSVGGTSEIKASFVTRISASTYNSLSMYSRGTTGDSVYVCFTPQSSAFQTEAITRCGSTTDTVGAGLPDDLIGIADDICTEEAEMICLP